MLGPLGKVSGLHEFFFCMDERKPSVMAQWRACAKSLSLAG
jgi:hypothetical protein